MWALNLSFSTIHPKIVISLKENSMGICVYLNGFFRPNKQQWAWTKIWMNQNQIYENKKNPFHFNYVRQILVGYYLKILKQFAELWLFPKYLCLCNMWKSPYRNWMIFFFNTEFDQKSLQARWMSLMDLMNGSLACAGLEKKTGRGSKISHAAVIIYCVRHYELISLIVLSEISSIIRKIFHNHQNFIVRRKVVALVGSVDLK